MPAKKSLIHRSCIRVSAENLTKITGRSPE